MAGFICGRLTHHPGLWRVDGIGNIRTSKDLGTRLVFHFSEIKRKFSKFPYDKDAPTGNTLPLPGHSSWLRLFTPGSLWDDGEKTGAARLETQQFQIDAGQCIYSQANEISRYAPFETLLPIQYLQFGDNHEPLTRAKYAFVPVLNQVETTVQWLIVPTAELFRFYLGNSNRLITKALTATTDTLIDTRSTTLVDQVLKIFDRTGTLTLREACCFGRTLTGPAARETFFGPQKYLASASAQKLTSQLYIDSRFPFTDRTTLLVAGKRIRIRNTSTGETNWAMYVAQIRRCTHSYGFSNVEITSTGAVNNGRGRGGGYGGGGPPRPPKVDPEDVQEINDERADPSMGTAVVGNLVYSSDPVTRIKMTRINVSREEFDGVRPRAVNTPSSGHTLEETSGGANGSGNQKIDMVDIAVKDVDRDVLNFIDMLHALREKTKNERWEIETLACADLPSKPVGDDVITSFPDMGGKFSWYLVPNTTTEESGALRPRLAVWVQIKIGTRYVYLVEMELKDKEPGRSSLAICAKKVSNKPIEFTEQNFKDLLTLTAIHHGWPPQGRKWKEGYEETAKELFEEFDFERIKHLYTIPVKESSKEGPAKNSKKEEDAPKFEIAEKRENVSVNQEEKPENSANANTSSKVSPDVWAADVYNKILEFFIV